MSRPSTLPVRLRVSSGDSLYLANHFDESQEFEIQVVAASDPTRVTTLWLTVLEASILRNQLNAALALGAR